MSQYNVVEKRVRFPCSGLSCSGDLFYPRGLKGDEPGIVAANGFGIVKEIGLPYYARFWAAAGYRVLIFDFRYLGRSGGEPRSRISPEEQLLDYLCAARFMERQGLSSDRVCAWGMGLSGAHVISLLAFSRAFACGVAQAPLLYMMKVGGNLPEGGLEHLLKIVSKGCQRICIGQNIDIPMASENLPASFMRGEVFEFFTEYVKRVVPDFPNEITVDSILRALIYNPGTYMHLVSKPLKIIVGGKDALVSLDDIREAYSRLRIEKELIIIKEAKHFDFLTNREVMLKAAREALKWFDKYLKKK